jgi:bifunctional UDP-N-acetylglucosamine pyrophosphorylase/glucosamine-1-phosphate N-acetyltransferase
MSAAVASFSVTGGAWPPGVYSCVGPGVILYEDLPDRMLVLNRQEPSIRGWGPQRYGW